MGDADVDAQVEELFYLHHNRTRALGDVKAQMLRRRILKLKHPFGRLLSLISNHPVIAESQLIPSQISQGGAVLIFADGAVGEESPLAEMTLLVPYLLADHRGLIHALEHLVGRLHKDQDGQLHRGMMEKILMKSGVSYDAETHQSYARFTFTAISGTAFVPLIPLIHSAVLGIPMTDSVVWEEVGRVGEDGSADTPFSMEQAGLEGSDGAALSEAVQEGACAGLPFGFSKGGRLPEMESRDGGSGAFSRQELEDARDAFFKGSNLRIFFIGCKDLNLQIRLAWDKELAVADDELVRPRSILDDTQVPLLEESRFFDVEYAASPSALTTLALTWRLGLAASVRDELLMGAVLKTVAAGAEERFAARADADNADFTIEDFQSAVVTSQGLLRASVEVVVGAKGGQGFAAPRRQELVNQLEADFLAARPLPENLPTALCRTSAREMATGFAQKVAENPREVLRQALREYLGQMRCSVDDANFKTAERAKLLELLTRDETGFALVNLGDAAWRARLESLIPALPFRTSRICVSPNVDRATALGQRAQGFAANLAPEVVQARRDLEAGSVAERQAEETRLGQEGSAVPAALLASLNIPDLPSLHTLRQRCQALRHFPAYLYRENDVVQLQLAEDVLSLRRPLEAPPLVVFPTDDVLTVTVIGFAHIADLNINAVRSLDLFAALLFYKKPLDTNVGDGKDADRQEANELLDLAVSVWGGPGAKGQGPTADTFAVAVTMGNRDFRSACLLVSALLSRAVYAEDIIKEILQLWAKQSLPKSLALGQELASAAAAADGFRPALTSAGALWRAAVSRGNEEAVGLKARELLGSLVPALTAVKDSRFKFFAIVGGVRDWATIQPGGLRHKREAYQAALNLLRRFRANDNVADFRNWRTEAPPAFTAMPAMDFRHPAAKFFYTSAHSVVKTSLVRVVLAKLTVPMQAAMALLMGLVDSWIMEVRGGKPSAYTPSLAFSSSAALITIDSSADPGTVWLRIVAELRRTMEEGWGARLAELRWAALMALHKGAEVGSEVDWAGLGSATATFRRGQDLLGEGIDGPLIQAVANMTEVDAKQHVGGLVNRLIDLGAEGSYTVLVSPAALREEAAQRFRQAVPRCPAPLFHGLDSALFG